MVTPNDLLRFFLELAVDPVRLLIEIAVFGSGVAALFAAAAQLLVVSFAVLAALHLALTFALGQRPPREEATAPPPS